MMSNRVWEYTKKHPLMIGGAVVVLFVGVLLLSGDSGDGETGGLVQSGPSDAQIASQTQLSMAQLAAQQSSAQLAAEKEVALAQLAADTTKANLAYQAVAYQTQAAEHKASYEYQLARYDQDNSRYALDTQSSLAVRQLDYQKQIYDAQIWNAGQQQQIDYQLNTNLINTQGGVARAQIGVQKSAIGAQKSSNTMSTIGNVASGFLKLLA